MIDGISGRGWYKVGTEKRVPTVEIAEVALRCALMGRARRFKSDGRFEPAMTADRAVLPLHLVVRVHTAPHEVGLLDSLALTAEPGSGNCGVVGSHRDRLQSSTRSIPRFRPASVRWFESARGAVRGRPPAATPAWEYIWGVLSDSSKAIPPCTEQESRCTAS